MEVKNLPKIELHVHLDGSIRYETVQELLNNEYSLDEVKDMLSVSSGCQDLNQYLEKFSVPLKVLQTKENLTRVSYELGQDLLKENVIYAEIRFAPLLHLENGLSISEVVEAVLAGLSMCQLKTNLLLCLMRGADEELNLATIEVAKRYLNKGVCGIDLAGAEALYENDLYKDLFSYAKSLAIPFTIHAGEARGSESIKSAIEFGAKRIGHGLNYDNDFTLIDEIIAKEITLEMCPTSNIHTKAVNSIIEHPINKLYKKGVWTTINTDNRTVSNTNLSQEYQLLLNNFELTISDIIKMNEYAIKSSFLSEIEKKELLKKYHTMM